MPGYFQRCATSWDPIGYARMGPTMSASRLVPSTFQTTMILWNLTKTALLITAFVAAMMVLIEYLNVQTQGLWLRVLGAGRWRQLALGALLGATPGCMGAYVVVALYTHRQVSFGAVVATMIATSGDEMFVMLGLFPTTALWMTLGLAIFGVLVGWVSDLVLSRRGEVRPGGLPPFSVHETDRCNCYPRGRILAQWRPPSPLRATWVVTTLLFTLAVALGELGPPAWDWKRVALLAVGGFVTFVAATVPEHFLEEHLYGHVARKHVPRLFAWTLGALVAVALLTHFVNLPGLISGNRWLVLLLAGLVGIIPESGPHLLFVTLYAQSTLPLGVLVASSAVQDGHGMLPLLAHSRRDFLLVKTINLVAGLSLGATILWIL